MRALGQIMSTSLLCLISLCSCIDPGGPASGLALTDPSPGPTIRFDLMPLLKGTKETVRSHAVSAAINGLPAVRMGSWKLIPGGGSGGWSKGGDQSQPIQLYDLSNDLGEMRNLAACEPERVGQIQDLFEDIIIRGRSTPGQRQSNDVRVRRFPVKTRQ